MMNNTSQLVLKEASNVGLTLDRSPLYLTNRQNGQFGWEIRRSVEVEARESMPYRAIMSSSFSIYSSSLFIQIDQTIPKTILLWWGERAIE